MKHAAIFTSRPAGAGKGRPHWRKAIIGIGTK